MRVTMEEIQEMRTQNTFSIVCSESIVEAKTGEEVQTSTFQKESTDAISVLVQQNGQHLHF